MATLYVLLFIVACLVFVLPLALHGDLHWYGLKTIWWWIRSWPNCLAMTVREFSGGRPDGELLDDDRPVGSLPPPAAAPPPPAPPPGPAEPILDGPDGPDSYRPEAMPYVAQEDLLHAIATLVAQASSGDIRMVRRVITTLGAASHGIGQGMTALATRLAEPDKRYDGSIHEPLRLAGAQVSSGSIRCAEADAALGTLGHMTLNELANSTRRSPHHTQTDGGNR